MKAGDLIESDGETGVILSFWSGPAGPWGSDGDWADVLWSYMGLIGPIPIDEIDEVISEGG